MVILMDEVLFCTYGLQYVRQIQLQRQTGSCDQADGVQNLINKSVKNTNKNSKRTGFKGKYVMAQPPTVVNKLESEL